MVLEGEEVLALLLLLWLELGWKTGCWEDTSLDAYEIMAWIILGFAAACCLRGAGERHPVSRLPGTV